MRNAVKIDPKKRMGKLMLDSCMVSVQCSQKIVDLAQALSMGTLNARQSYKVVSAARQILLCLDFDP